MFNISRYTSRSSGKSGATGVDIKRSDGTLIAVATPPEFTVLDSSLTIKDADNNVLSVESVLASNSEQVVLANAKTKKEKRHDFQTPYSYCATAPIGSSEGANVWNITRIEILSNGTTIKTYAVNVNWTDRYTHTYNP